MPEVGLNNNDFREIWDCADLATAFSYERIRRRIHHNQASIYQIYREALETVSGLPKLAMESEEKTIADTARTGMSESEIAESERKYLAIIDRYAPLALKDYRI